MAHLLMIEGWVSESGNLILPLLKQLGHTYSFVTRNPALYKSAHGSDLHPLFENAEDVTEVDTNNIPELIEAVKNRKFDGVITVCDYYLEAVRSVAEALDVPCPVPDNLQNIRQKHLMRKAFNDAGVANAEFRLADSWEDTVECANQIGYPLIVKPVDLASSAFVSLVRNEIELRNAYNALSGFTVNFRHQERNTVILLEEFLIGEEVSVESISFQGEISIIGITDKSVTGNPYFIETGHMFPAILSDDSHVELIAYIKESLKAVGFDNGIAHTEVKLTKAGPRIVEINPRTPGNYIVELIERVTGINLLKVFLGLSLGEKPNLLCKETGIKSASVMFLVPPKEGTLAGIKGLETLAENPHLIRYNIPDFSGKHIETPTDNDCYLGHIMSFDKEGQNARKYVEHAINQVELLYED